MIPTEIGSRLPIKSFPVLVSTSTTLRIPRDPSTFLFTFNLDRTCAWDSLRSLYNSLFSLNLGATKHRDCHMMNLLSSILPEIQHDNLRFPNYFLSNSSLDWVIPRDGPKFALCFFCLSISVCHNDEIYAPGLCFLLSFLSEITPGCPGIPFLF